MRIDHLLLAGLLASCASAAVSQQADMIWTGGPILTMNDAAMRAEAVAVSKGRIIAVGSAADVMKLKGAGTQIIDLKGQALLPGFYDSHGHVMGGGLQALTANLLAPPDGTVTDVPSLQAKLKEWLAANEKNVKAAGLIIGFGYDQSQMKELRHPTRADLDLVSKDIPIVLVHQSSHFGVLNSAALAKVGYTAATPDPSGGVIRRQEGGKEPDGVLEETAFHGALAKLLPALGPAGFKTFARNGAKLWASYGFTTAQDGRATPGTVKLMREVADEGGFEIDIDAYSDVLINRDAVRPMVSRDYKGHFRLAGYKLTIDGSPQGFTAWRDRPYYAPVGNYPAGYSGYAAATEKAVIDAIDWTYGQNVQIIVHSSGERASDLFISAVDAAAAKHGLGDRRSTLIHGHFLREDQMDKMKQVGIVPSLFTMHTFYWGDWHRDQTVGPVLAENITPTGWAFARGMKFTVHHDAPVAFPDSMRILDATVTRRTRSGDIIGPAQRVDVMTGLKALTLWGAYQGFEDKDKGSLEIGKLADMVVLSADPTKVDPETIDQIKVMTTIKAGKTIYTRGPEKNAQTDRTNSLYEGSAARLLVMTAAGLGQGSHAQPARLPIFSALARLGVYANGDNSCVSQAALIVADAMIGSGQ